MCIGLVNAQTSGRVIYSIIGIIIGIVAVIFFLLLLVYFLVKICKFMRSEEPSISRPVMLPTPYSYPGLQLRSEPSYSNSDPTSTFTGVPHSTVPLESELQNAPPPDYSTAHQYPVYTQPDEATSQNKSTPHGEEPTAEAPPSYDEGHIQEPPPPYPGPPQ